LADATARTALSASSWRDALDAVADWAGEGPVLVVLDEFQHIARTRPDIGSIVNVWWRERGADLPIFLALCGSTTRRRSWRSPRACSWSRDAPPGGLIGGILCAPRRRRTASTGRRTG